MKIVLFVLLWSQGLFAARDLPLGIWHAPSVTADDGRWGKYYQSWLTVNQDSIDHIYVMGAHYIKVKYLINKIEDSKYFVYNTYERESSILTLESQGQTLRFCFNENACTNYQAEEVLPDFTDPVPGFPSVQISARWCVDEDCQWMDYLPVESEMFFNLYSKPQPHTFAFWGPEELSNKYDIDVGVYSMSYRLSNDTSRLDSFASSLSLMGGGFERGGILSRSSVFLLKEGELISIEGHDGKHTVKATFYLKLK